MPSMPRMDVQNPGMPDLQFVLFVSALCTSNLTSINVSTQLRNEIFRKEMERQTGLWLDELREKAHIQLKL